MPLADKSSVIGGGESSWQMAMELVTILLALLFLCTRTLKIVHIGAGVSNVVTATLLKKQYPACDISIYEQGNRCGGRLGSFYLGQDEYRFDIGPSLLLLRDVYLKTMREMGLSSQDVQSIENHVFRPVDPFYRVYFEGEEHSYIDLSADKTLLQKQLNTVLTSSSLSGSTATTADMFEEYMNIANAFLDFGLPAVIEEQPFQHLDKFPAFLQSCLKAFPLFSHDKMITDLFKGSKIVQDDKEWTTLNKVRALLSFQDLYVGLAPSETPAVFSLLQALEFSQGIYYPIGGFEAVTNILVEAAQQTGVQIYTNKRLKAVMSEGNKVKSIVLEDRITRRVHEEKVDMLVSNIDVPRFENKYMACVNAAADDNGDNGSAGKSNDDGSGDGGGDGRNTNSNSNNSNCDRKDDRSASMRPSCAVLSFHWGFSEKLHFLSHHNIFLSPDLDKSWDTVKYPDGIFISEGNADVSVQASDKGAFDGDVLNFYVHAPSRTDPSAAPVDGDALTILVPVPPLPMEMEMIRKEDNQNENSHESVERAVADYEQQLIEQAKGAVMRRLGQAWQAYNAQNIENGIDGSTSEGNESVAAYTHKLLSSIVVEKVVTPSEWSDNYNLFRGSAFGLAHSLDQLSVLRPAKRHPKLRNIYRVGASTTPGNGVPLCMIGGRLAALEIGEVLKRQYEVGH